MSEIARLRSVIDRMEAEGWEPRYSAVTIGAMQQWRIDWTRKPPRVTLISADSGREVKP